MLKKSPYYAVIFTSVLNPSEDYEHMANQMLELAQKQPVFLGFESAREEIGITISYWESLEAIKNWKENSFHQLAQQKGKNEFYQSYSVKICKVEKAYDFFSKK